MLVGRSTLFLALMDGSDASRGAHGHILMLRPPDGERLASVRLADCDLFCDRNVEAVHPAYVETVADGGLNYETSGSAGSAARLAQMFAAHALPLRMSLARVGLSEDAAEDALQQAFLIASERVRDIIPGRERSFLFGIVYRLRCAANRRVRRIELVADMDTQCAPGPDAEAAMEGREALDVINQALGSLDDALAEAFLMCEVEQRSTTEVAERLGIPRGTAASRRRRARQVVVAHLGASSAPEPASTSYGEEVP